jgi:gamma-glutamyltranspeptidase/glutathione hydrolase
MEAGGSAVDGAIAVNAVLGVVLPDTCGVGGDLFALVHRPGDPAPAALNASGRAGSGAHAADVRSAGHVEIPLRSTWSVTVPGCVDGWEVLHARYGRLPIDQVLGVAIDLAANGFPVSPELSDSLHRIHPLIGAEPSAPALYPNGDAPDAGRVVRRPQLAETLAGIAAAGREAFYAGPAGFGITDATEGMVTASDLERRQAEWVEPIGLEVFGHTGWTIPPNSQGYLTLAAAYLFEQVSPGDASPAMSAHTAIEAYRAVAAERDTIVSDPATAPIHERDLLDPVRLDALGGLIDGTRAGVYPAPRRGPGGTAYMCAVDAAGMAVSLIQSNFHGIGSGRSAGATGVFLHNRGAGFSVVEGHPNELLPGRRPLHTLAPTLWTDAGRLRAVLGTRGGDHQPQLLLQVAINLWWHAMDAADAVAAPRWIVDGWAPGVSSRIRLEAPLAQAIGEDLEALHHEVQAAGESEAGWGPVALIEAGDQRVRGVADPRVSTAAAAASPA